VPPGGVLTLVTFVAGGEARRRITGKRAGLIALF
jgi:hypothetical protein